MVKARKTASNGPVNIRAEFRKLGLLVEQSNDNFRAVQEQYGSINRKLDQHSKILESHSRILEWHSQMLKSHTEMIAKLAVDLTIVKEDIALIKNAVKRKVDLDDFAALERRVALLERKR